MTAGENCKLGNSYVVDDCGNFHFAALHCDAGGIRPAACVADGSQIVAIASCDPVSACKGNGGINVAVLVLALCFCDFSCGPALEYLCSPGIAEEYGGGGGNCGRSSPVYVLETNVTATCVYACAGYVLVDGEAKGAEGVVVGTSPALKLGKATTTTSSN